jgi:hypothetical protein
MRFLRSSLRRKVNEPSKHMVNEFVELWSNGRPAPYFR